MLRAHFCDRTNLVCAALVTAEVGLVIEVECLGVEEFLGAVVVCCGGDLCKLRAVLPSSSRGAAPLLPSSSHGAAALLPACPADTVLYCLLGLTPPQALHVRSLCEQQIPQRFQTDAPWTRM